VSLEAYVRKAMESSDIKAEDIRKEGEVEWIKVEKKEPEDVSRAMISRYLL
jgi:hypothetical protein